MDAVAMPASARSAAWGLVVFAALVGGPLAFSLGFAADSKLLPQGSGLRDGRDPDWSTDANDPFPGEYLIDQTVVDIDSAGVCACQVADQFLECRWILKGIVGKN